MTSSPTACVDPSGQFCEYPNEYWILLASVNIDPPPSIAASTFAPKLNTNTNNDPITIPGLLRGSRIRRNSV